MMLTMSGLRKQHPAPAVRIPLDQPFVLQAAKCFPDRPATGSEPRCELLLAEVFTRSQLPLLDLAAETVPDLVRNTSALQLCDHRVDRGGAYEPRANAGL